MLERVSGIFSCISYISTRRSIFISLETKKTLSDTSESGAYIVPIRDQWSEFVFLSKAGEITDKKLIQRYISVFKEDLQRA